MPTATKDAETKFCTSEELKRQTLNGRQTLRPDSTTGITVLPAWMDAPEDEGLYDTSCDPAPRDIWLAYVEFADHEGVGKVRPVVILDASGEASVITAKITASANYEPSSFVEISDWESCGLRRPSWVQIEPLVEVRRDKLLRDEPLGQLSLSTYELVCAALGSVNQHPLPEPDKPLPGAMRRGEEGSRVRLGHA